VGGHGFFTVCLLDSGGPDAGRQDIFGSGYAVLGTTEFDTPQRTKTKNTPTHICG